VYQAECVLHMTRCVRLCPACVCHFVVVVATR